MSKNPFYFVLMTVVGMVISLSNLLANEPLEFMAGEILLKFKNETSLETKKEFERQFNLVPLRESKATGVCLYRASQDDVLDLIKKIKKHEGIEFAEPNYIQKKTSIPNDPLYANQWYMPKIRMPEAWGEYTGSATVKVAVIDGGVSKYHNEIRDFQQGAIDVQEESWTRPYLTDLHRVWTIKYRYWKRNRGRGR